MKILENRFGRPDFIIKVLIEKVKKALAPRTDDLGTLIDFSNIVTNLVATMQSFKHTGHLMNPQMMETLVTKLPSSLRLQWGEVAAARRPELPDLTDFSSWLELKAEAASYIPTSSESDGNRRSYRDHAHSSGGDRGRYNTQYQSRATVMTTILNSCQFCKKKNHDINYCTEFKGLSNEDKWNWIREEKRCFSCMKLEHGIRDCPTKKKCNVHSCPHFHHPILHEFRQTTATVAHSSSIQPQVMLRVLPVILSGPTGEFSTYALLDEGSTVTLLDERIATQIGAEGPVNPVLLRWTNDTVCDHNDSRSVNLKIRGKTCNDEYELTNVHTMKNMNLPCQSVNATKLKGIWNHLKCVEFDSLCNVQPMILLGQDNCHLSIAREVIEADANAPVLSNTKLGWVVHGNAKPFRNRVDDGFLFFVDKEKTPDDLLHEMVKTHWQTESFGVSVSKKDHKYTKDESRALSILKAKTKRVDKRWETGLLWSQDKLSLPDSKPTALSRLYSIEKKMDQDPQFAAQYTEKIEDYMKKGYAHKLSDKELTFQHGKVWYLPHFPVSNVNKPGKIRLVFDAAAKTKGTSLNDVLLKGPDLLQPLMSVLFKFRQKEVAICGDIREMFHQINICEEDQPAQRFLW